MKKKGTLIIYTGGTIGMSQVDVYDGFLKNSEKIIANILDLLELQIGDRVVFTSKIIDSSQFNYLIMNEIINIIKTEYLNYNGFLIVGGTDTMAYLQSILKWQINGLKKPIILTGSINSFDQDEKEGIDNIKYALTQLNRWKDKGFVGICMNRKLHIQPTTKYDSLSKTPYNEIVNSYLEEYRFELQNINDEVIFHNLKDIKIEIIYLNPFMYFTRNKELADGLIILTYGQGTTVDDSLFQERVKQYNEKNKPIVFISQCFNNKLNIKQYLAGKFLNEVNGIICPGSCIEESLAFINYKLSNNILIS